MMKTTIISFFVLSMTFCACNGNSKSSIIEMPEEAAARLAGHADSSVPTLVVEENVVPDETETIRPSDPHEIDYADLMHHGPALFSNWKQVQKCLDSWKAGEPFSAWAFGEAFYPMVERYRYVEGHIDDEESLHRMGEIINEFHRRAVSRIPNLLSLFDLVSADGLFGFKAITANTIPFMNVIGYRSGSSYKPFYLDLGQMYAYNRINQVKMDGRTLYILNVDHYDMHYPPRVFSITNGQLMEYTVEDCERSWEKFCSCWEEGIHVDFNPGKAMWTLCHKVKKGIWDPIPGMTGVRLQVNGTKAAFVVVNH